MNVALEFVFIRDFVISRVSLYRGALYQGLTLVARISRGKLKIKRERIRLRKGGKYSRGLQKRDHLIYGSLAGKNFGFVKASRLRCGKKKKREVRPEISIAIKTEQKTTCLFNNVQLTN